jgi:myosin heavy subunit
VTLRQPIDTAPKDGRDIWVEDDRAAYDVAHWSSETKQWVWKNGEAIRITPTHWSPIPELQYQEGEQLGSPTEVAGVRWSTVSLIAAALVVAALTGVYFRTEMVAFATRYADLLDIVDTGRVGGRENLGTPTASDVNLRESAGAAQSSAQREVTSAPMQDGDAARHGDPASTAQIRQALEQETVLSDKLAGELAATRSELDAKVACADKAVDEAAQLKRAAEVTAAELQQERERSATLASDLAKARIDLAATATLASKSHDEALQGSLAAEEADGLRKSLQEERAHAAALASELSGNRRDMETQAEQSQKAVAAAVKQQQGAETAIAELRRSFQQEQKKTATLTQEAKAAQAEMRREIESKTAQSQKAIDAVTKQKQATETAAAELRRSLQQEQQKTATLAEETKAAQAEMRREIETQAEQSQKAADEAVQAATAQLREALQQEQQKTAALTQEAKAAQAMTTAADPERRPAETTIADLQSPQQEHQQAGMLSSDVRRKLKALATLSRQSSDKTVSNQAAEDAKAELKSSLRQKRGQPKGITPSAETTRQSAGTAATEQPVSTEANASEASGLLSRAKALVKQGNILAARTVLERAAETGSAQATFALAETYDPNVLAIWRTRGTRGDATRAHDLYARAYEGGIKAAKDRSDSLVIGNSE